MMIFRNGLFPGLVWHGEQGNEHQHAFFADNKILKGHYGILRAKIRKDYLSNKWNRQRLFQYIQMTERNYMKELNWSEKLLTDMMNGVHDAQIMNPILQQIYSRGVYITENIQDTVKKDCINEMVLQQLEFTSTPKWSPRLYEIVEQYLLQNGYKRFSKIAKSEYVLTQIANILHDKFDHDFLERRINCLGFYFS